ncbi:permease [Sphingomonas gilva]|uniref:Permease n=1 Tax=Sphingomonas gilva TaxID=2305907 RepID=A0A396RY12_9SPHN|nr:FtsX-like permease family protein [Sphingomonas gilva]RHW18611.1 permease [Sphingomonas gilva]
MSFGWAASPPDSRLLQEGRLTGPMPWIIAIMMFLTALAAAAGLGLANASSAMDARLAGRLTVQIVDADAESRARDARRVATALETLPGVAKVEQADRAELAALLEPYLGADGLDRDLPMPALIDVDLDSAEESAVAEVEGVVARIAPAARVDRHARWLAPVESLFGWLTWLSIMMVLLMAAATGAAVVLAARGALNTHRATIDVLHLMGATDRQVARLFQRRIALDALLGGATGLVVALIVIMLLGWQVGSLQSELASGVTLAWRDWLLLLALPLLFAALATLAARTTILAALRKLL